MNINEWLQQAQNYLVNSWGLEKSFASRVAMMLAYFQQYGLNPHITSGFRGPEKHMELLRRWEAGDKTVRVKPAENSLHDNESWGKPASLAIDIATNNEPLAAQIAEAVGVKSGIRFQVPDAIHFYS